MSDMSEQSRAGATRNALAEAADRFDRIARVVKDQQLSETRSGPRIALTETYTASPEEAWAKKFMTQAIGPATTTFSAPAVPVVAAPIPPAFSQGFSSSLEQASAEPRKEATTSFRPGGDLRLGSALQVERVPPQGKRTWIGWLLLGR